MTEIATTQEIENALTRIHMTDLVGFSDGGEENSISDLERISAGGYHPPISGPHDEFRGLRWQDMPGSDSDCQKLNFSLFRRGLYNPEVNAFHSMMSKTFQRTHLPRKKKVGGVAA